MTTPALACQFLDLSHISYTCMSLTCTKLRQKSELVFLFLRRFFCHHKNVQQWLFLLDEAKNFLNDPRIYIYIYIYIFKKKIKTSYMRIINLFPSCYGFWCKSKTQKKKKIKKAPGKFKCSLLNGFLSWWNYSQLQFKWIE